MTSTPTAEVTDIRAYRVPSACKALGLSKSALYREMQAGRLHAVKAGAITLIPAEALTAWLASLPSRPAARAA